MMLLCLLQYDWDIISGCILHPQNIDNDLWNDMNCIQWSMANIPKHLQCLLPYCKLELARLNWWLRFDHQFGGIRTEFPRTVSEGWKEAGLQKMRKPQFSGEKSSGNRYQSLVKVPGRQRFYLDVLVVLVICTTFHHLCQCFGWNLFWQ